MNTPENTPANAHLVTHAAYLANAHIEGCEHRCRRWRHWATVRRWVSLILLLAVAALLSGSVTHSLTQGAHAVGALATDEAVAVVWQIILNQ